MRQDPPHPLPRNTPDSAAAPETVAPEPGETAGQRNRRLAHIGVAHAQRVLTGRYRLASQQEAFELLRQTSQRFNIKLHTLADAVLHTAAPDTDAELWFPSRARYTPPPLPNLAVDESSRTNHGVVLRNAMRRVLHITETTMGNVQLSEQGMLRMEKHTGLNQEFTDFFAFVRDSTTSCAQSAEQRQQITVKDVAVADVFDDESRHAILQAGSRAAHSVPLVGRKDRVVGIISSHHEQPLSDFTRAQLAALEALGTQVGRWLLWHRHTIVLDALEQLHAAATAQGVEGGDGVDNVQDVQPD
ncbi:GAF and ANTAR domain-containing protein [Streptomyces sp. NPDC057621]|uniref:GAF and ANTAR domain-containing protein n=1 Tax=Streptomyces sp. NPDC057621 TaxID=3346186 RepID=UPI00367F7D78